MTPDQHLVLHDPARLAEVIELDLASERLDPAFDQIAGRAATALGWPIGLVSIVLDETQYLIGLHGLEGTYLAASRGTPVEWAFCRHTVERRAPFVVPDAPAEPLVAESPITRLDGVRSYAGVPLITGAGHAVGSLCVLDSTPRAASGPEVTALQRLAEEVVALIEARRGAPAATDEQRRSAAPDERDVQDRSAAPAV